MTRCLILVLCLSIFGGAALGDELTYSVGGHRVSQQTFDLTKAAQKLEQSGDLPAAAEKYRQAIQLEPKVAALHFNRGVVLFKLSKFKESSEECGQAMALDPKFAEAFATGGSAYQAAGDLAKAAAAYRRYLEMVPNATRYRDALEIVEQELKRQAETSTKFDVPGTYLSSMVPNGVLRWSADKMPLKVHIAVDPSVPGYKPEYEKILKQSFEEWAKGASDTVSFQFVPDSAGSDISCGWTADTSKVAAGGEGAHTQSEYTDKGLRHISLVFLTVVPAGEVLSSQTLRLIYLHEIGHALGLMGHSPNPADIMYSARASDDATMHSVTGRDFATLKALYARPIEITNRDAFKVPGLGRTAVARSIVLNGEGIKLVQQGEFQAAIEKFEEAVATNGDLTIARENLGMALNKYAVAMHKQGDLAAAESLYKRAIEVQEPINSKYLGQSLRNYALVLKRLKRDEEAAQIEQRAVRLP